MLAIISTLEVSRLLTQSVFLYCPNILGRLLFDLIATLGYLLCLRHTDAIKSSRPASVLCDHLSPTFRGFY